MQIENGERPRWALGACYKRSGWQPRWHRASLAQLAGLPSGKAFPEGNLGETVKSPKKVHTV